jgi:hypothetical protein
MNHQNSSKEIRIGHKVLTEDDLKFTVEYNGEIFTMKLPNPFEKSMIETELARKLGGHARNTYPADHLALMEATAYVDNLVVRDESPDWFSSAWSCYDEDCIVKLYTGYLSFRGQFQERIRSKDSEGIGKGSKS